MVVDRERSAAWLALSRGTKRVYSIIAAAIGDGEYAAVSYRDLMLYHHVGRQRISPSIKALETLGFVEIRRGVRLANVFSLSTRWRFIDADEVERLLARAGRRLSERPERPRLPKPERSYALPSFDPGSFLGR